MTAEASRFYASVGDVRKLSDKELVAMFVYYLTVEKGAPSASAKLLTRSLPPRPGNPVVERVRISSSGVPPQRMRPGALASKAPLKTPRGSLPANTRSAPVTRSR